ncbi:MAG: hypothetical protein AAGC55_16655 [Myxococcota bacterium]
MKKNEISQDVVEQTVAALDEVEEAVLGEKVESAGLTVKTGIKAGGCLPGSCPRPLYGLPPDTATE